ncbi:hypothetical protein HY640_03970, partial [Candidatus Woesearchaeota archaeon]|nr:hypothetical protein [Candidatus Woesearchaeota archaeon]
MAAKKMVKKEKAPEDAVLKKPQEKPQPAQEEKKGGQVFFSPAVPGRVVELVGRAGVRGDAIQVRVKV